MPQSNVFPFADPAEFRSVVRAADGELLVTGKGDFRSEVIRIDLSKLWMQRISDRLPRIIQASNDPSRAAILFHASVNQPPMRNAGVDVGPHEIVAAVAHKQFLQRDVADYRKKLVNNGCFIDVKSQFDVAALAANGVRVWRL